MPIRAILFDLGNTLMHAVAPPEMWPEVIRRGNEALMEHLCSQGILEGCNTFVPEFNQRLRQYYAERDKKMLETSTFLVLKEMLAEKGYPDISDRIIRDSLDAHYAYTQKNWILEKDTLHCLDTLQQANYKLGIISNAGDDRDVQQLVEKFNIVSYFEIVLTSAACGYRKPHQRIFELALEYFNVKPEEVAMVGDTLEADIQGANQMGIYSVWITRRATIPVNGELPFQPQATIKTLAELPLLLHELEIDLHL